MATGERNRALSCVTAPPRALQARGSDPVRVHRGFRLRPRVVFAGNHERRNVDI